MPQPKQHANATVRKAASRRNQKLQRLGPLAALFPYWGGKRVVAPLIWQRLGNVPHYIEPFAGSLAVLLARPHPPKAETVNDADGLLVNVWRALQYEPHAVAHYADSPRVQHRTLGEKRSPREPAGASHGPAHCRPPLLRPRAGGALDLLHLHVDGGWRGHQGRPPGLGAHPPYGPWHPRPAPPGPPPAPLHGAAGATANGPPVLWAVGASPRRRRAVRLADPRGDPARSAVRAPSPG